jgi:hypothetical protein
VSFRAHSDISTTRKHRKRAEATTLEGKEGGSKTIKVCIKTHKIKDIHNS